LTVADIGLSQTNFAHRLEEELAHKISDLQGMIDEVCDFNFDDAAEAA
jgi:hypothetical protein